MGSQPPLSERRRGERVLIRIPVKIYAVGKDGRHINENAETMVVSRFGALLRLSTPLKHGTSLELTNNFTEKTERFRVIWVADKPKEGKFDVGIELATPKEEFWGVTFPGSLRKA